MTQLISGTLHLARATVHWARQQVRAMTSTIERFRLAPGLNTNSTIAERSPGAEDASCPTIEIGVKSTVPGSAQVPLQSIKPVPHRVASGPQTPSVQTPDLHGFWQPPPFSASVRISRQPSTALDHSRRTLPKNPQCRTSTSRSTHYRTWSKLFTQCSTPLAYN